MLIRKVFINCCHSWPFLPLLKGFNIGGQIGFSRAFLSLNTVSVNHFLIESCRFIFSDGVERKHRKKSLCQNRQLFTMSSIAGQMKTDQSS